jgi:glyoxylase I family protein
MAEHSAQGTAGFHHVALRVTDFDTSYAFYTRGLGFTPAHEWGSDGNRAVMLDTGDGSFLEIFEGGDAAREPEGAVLHFALRTQDCDGVTERARTAGAEVTVEPKDVDIPADPVLPVRIAFFKGPDKEVIELFQIR